MDEPTTHNLEATLRLVERAQDGDRAALEDLFTRYLPRVRRIIGYRVGQPSVNAGEVDDILQEALMKAFRSLDQFDPGSEGTFYNWLSRCAEHQIVDYFRTAKAQKRGGGRVRRFGDYPDGDLRSSIFHGDEPTSSQVYSAKELEGRIDAALHTMSEKDREMIILRQLCEMSYGEMMVAMEFPSEEATRKAFARALKKLREIVET